ncbi:MAG: tyrosine-type recombinase/integrase [Planctomycetota bacterium]
MIPHRLGRALGLGKLTLEKRGNGPARWTLDWKGADGQRRRQVLSNDRRVAQRLQAEIIRSRDLEAAGMAPVEGLSKPFREIAAMYLEDLQTRVTPGHYDNVRARIERLNAKIGSKPIRDIRPMEIVQVRSEGVARGLANHTANRLADAAVTVLRWAVQNQLVAQNPLEHMKRLPDGPAHARCVRRALTENEYNALLMAADEDDANCSALALLEERTRVPQRILFQTLVESGMRFGEARTLRWGDLDTTGRLIVVRAENAKGRKQRVIPIREGLAQELRALRVLHERVLGRIPTAAENTFLTPDGVPWKKATTNVRRLLLRLLERAGIQRVDVQGRHIDVHALRATCATRMARAGVPLVQTQRILGHSTPVLTSRHYSLVDADDLREAVETVPVPPTARSASPEIRQRTGGSRVGTRARSA